MIKLSNFLTIRPCKFYDINFCKSLPNGLELLQLSSSSWFLFQLGSWKAKINCVKPTLKKQHAVLHLLISISGMLYDHYSIINVWLVFWFLKWEFFLNVSSKHAFFFQLLMSKFCYFVITFIYQPCVLQLNFKCFIFCLKNIVKLLKLELTSPNSKLNERAHQRIIRLLMIKNVQHVTWSFAISCFSRIASFSAESHFFRHSSCCVTNLMNSRKG